MRIPIPDIQRQIEPTGGPAPTMARPVAQTGLADLGAALTGLGRERAQEVQAREANALRADFEQKKARVVERASAARLQWAETLQKRQAEAPDGADGFTPGVLRDFDTWQEQSLQAVPDEDERRMLQGMLGGVREHLGAASLQFEGQQRRAYRKRVIDDGVDTDARTVMADPAQFGDVLAMRVAAINSSTDHTAEERAGMVQRARETIAFNAAATLAQRDPAGWLKRDPAQDPIQRLMDPKQLRAVNEHARALAERAANDMQRQGERALKDAEKAVEDLRTFTLSGGLPDLAYQAQVQRLTAGTPYAEAASAMLQAASAGAAFGAQSLPKQAAALQAMGQGGSPEQKRLIDFARQVHETQRRAFEDDPWAAASRFHRLPDAPEMAISSPDLAARVVQQRLQTIAGVETSAGRPVSPLRPNEAVQWATQLQSLPPDQRAQKLGEVGAMLNVGQVGALAEQLDKGNKPLALSLKLGLDRTTAGRTTSALVLRGAQALADKTVKRDDMALSGWRAEIAGLVRGTLGDDRAEQDVIDAAYYVRAAMDAESTAAPGYSLKASNENAVRMVIGTPLDRGGVKTLTPRGMDVDTFDRQARAALQPMAGQTLYIRGKPTTAEELAVRLPSYGMKRDGQGRYTPVLNGAYVTTDPEGQQPLRLEVR